MTQARQLISAVVNRMIAEGGTPVVEQRAPTTEHTVKLTRDQKRALADYEFRLREEDRYLGSVFWEPQGQRDIEAKTRIAYERCISLGMTHKHMRHNYG
jgi:hypothetical protein